MRRDSYDICIDIMFSGKELELSQDEKQMVERTKDAYTVWLNRPTMTDPQIRDYLMVNHAVSKQVAYSDIARVKSLLGNVPVAAKEFFRHKVNYILDKATASAEAGDHAKAKSLQKIADSIIRNNRLETEESEKIPFEKIIPQDLSISTNPKVAGVPVIPGARAKAMKLMKK